MNNSEQTLLELHKTALDLFTSADAALTWLNLPHPLLDGITPADAAKTEIGSIKVQNLLMSIKFGGVS